MKKAVVIMLTVSILITSIFIVTPYCFAASQTTDIASTQLLNTNTYYSFDAQTKTLTISGTGATPDFSNSSGAVDSQPWISWRSDGSIENVVVEEGITELGAYFFYYVRAESFSLPSTLKRVGRYSMAGTNAMTSLVLPDELEAIADYAFYNTINLVSINIPETVTSIGSSAFERCISLSQVEFENMSMSVSLGRKAFLSCESLNSLTLPKNATLASYSVGYYNASRGSVYDDFVMKVYRDSSAYTYAVNNLIAYELISGISIREAHSVSCSYYEDNSDDTMEFYFTPDVSAIYDFYSEGEPDVDCTLYDSEETVLSSATDNSAMDLNFTLTYQLQAGQTYCYRVNNVASLGSFSVCVYPHTVSDIELDCEISLDAQTKAVKRYDIMSIISGQQINVVFDTGYSETVEFSSNCIVGKTAITYRDLQTIEPWSCGINNYYLQANGFTKAFDAQINHVCTTSTVPATDYDCGYTIYTCRSCGESWQGDFVKRNKIKVSGNVVLMEHPDGSHPHNYPVYLADIEIHSRLKAVTDENGYFEFYLDEPVEEIVIDPPFYTPITVEMSVNEYNDALFINSPVINTDYYDDGYINIKDIIALKEVSGSYDPEEIPVLVAADYNRDGVIDEHDWKDTGMFNFFLMRK